MELGSRAEAVLHRRRTEEAVEIMKPLPCLLPFLPANGTLMAGTSVHSVVMKASGWEIPQEAETTPLSTACYDKGVQQEPPTHPCTILKPHSHLSKPCPLRESSIKKRPQRVNEALFSVDIFIACGTSHALPCQPHAE